MKDLAQELTEAQQLLTSYLDLAADQQEDDAFVARGNGFCDRKYSDDFLQLRIAQLTARVAELKKQTEGYEDKEVKELKKLKKLRQ